VVLNMGKKKKPLEARKVFGIVDNLHFWNDLLVHFCVKSKSLFRLYTQKSFLNKYKIIILITQTNLKFFLGCIFYTTTEFKRLFFVLVL